MHTAMRQFLPLLVSCSVPVLALLLGGCTNPEPTAKSVARVTFRCPQAVTSISRELSAEG